MKKYLFTGIIIILILSIIIPFTNAYAINEKEDIKEESFFEVSTAEVVEEGTLEATIYLDKISYNKFIFELQSDSGIDEVKVKEEVKVEKEANEIYIEIDKETTNLEKIVLTLKMPNTLKVGDVATLKAQVTNSENPEEMKKAEAKVTIIKEEKQDEKEENNTSQDNQNNQEQNQNNEKESQNNNQNNTQLVANVNSQEENINENQTSQKVSNTEQTTTVQTKTEITLSSSQEKETVTYNGSDNNYLSELSVCNYSFSKAFSKENTTYFLTVESDVETLEVIATNEDENATVCIYGNENLKQGSNKILICVTAENGNVRNYRIYVTRTA